MFTWPPSIAASRRVLCMMEVKKLRFHTKGTKQKPKSFVLYDKQGKSMYTYYIGGGMGGGQWEHLPHESRHKGIAPTIIHRYSYPFIRYCIHKSRLQQPGSVLLVN